MKYMYECMNDHMKFMYDLYKHLRLIFLWKKCLRKLYPRSKHLRTFKFF